MKVKRSIDISFHQDLWYTEFPLSKTPYISTVNAEEEYLRITNPSDSEISLHGYFVSDSKKMHRFEFSDTCTISSFSEITLYTCPGSHLSSSGSWVEPHVLWTNHDGTLRRKEVLNNDHCEMLLFEPNGKCLSSCVSTVNHDGTGHIIVKRRQEELHSLPVLSLSSSSQFKLSSLRLAFIITFLCDLFSRELTNHTESLVLSSLNLFGDDMNLISLYIMAFMSQSDKFAQVIIIFSAMLEFTTRHFSAKTVSPNVLINIEKDIYDTLRRFHACIVTAVCLGSEIFLLSYINTITSEGLLDVNRFYALGVMVTSLAFLIRQIANIGCMYRYITKVSIQDGEAHIQLK